MQRKGEHEDLYRGIRSSLGQLRASLRKRHLSTDLRDEWYKTNEEGERVLGKGNPMCRVSSLEPYCLYFKTVVRASSVVSLPSPSPCKRLGRVGIIFLSKGLTIASPYSNIFSESLVPLH